MRRSVPHCRRLLTALFGIVCLSILAACAVPGIDPALQSGHLEAKQQRLAQTRQDLEALERVDLLVDLDSRRLVQALRGQLADALGDVPGWSGDDVNITVSRGYLALDLQGRYGGPADEAVPVTLFGELVPAFQPGRLAWRIQLTHASTIPSGALSPEAHQRLETDLAAALSRKGVDRFLLEPLPLGILEAGIRLRAPFEVVRSESRALSGLPIPEKSAVLIGPERTRLALQLGFVPELPYCEPTVGIGRAGFAGNIENREPVDPRVTQARPGEARVFFSEITGARAPTTVVHYWFADGSPVAVSSLNVEPSARWRTWSAAPDDVSRERGVSRWQVLVLEERSGCILTQQTLEIVRDSEATGQDKGPGFEDLDRLFRERTAHLTPESGTDAPAVIALDRRFLGMALGEAMYDLSLEAGLKAVRPEPLRVNLRLGAPASETLSCDSGRCESERVCALDFERCPLQRDTRDCSSCLLRNPLNNRCLRESEDPICLAARDSENERLDLERQACVDRETAQRDRCVRERERTLDACRRRQSAETGACSAQVQELADRARALRPIASLVGEVTLDGALDFIFSEFRVDPDLQRIRMRLSVDGSLASRGSLRFIPAADLDALSRCLTSRTAQLDDQLSLAPWRGGVVSDLDIEGSRLVADWSGLVQRLDATPTPASQFFTLGEPVLDTCPTGLEAARLLDNSSGPGSDWLRGFFELDMHPEPTRITLLPAYLQVGDDDWTGEPELEAERVIYRVNDPN
jgi:hypothetical protein